MTCMKEKSLWRRQTKPQRRVPKALNPNKSANKDSPRTLVASPDISSRSGAKNLSSTPGQNNSSCLFSDYRKFFIVPKHLSEAALPYLDNPTIQIRLWIFWACHTIHHWRLLCFLLAYPNNPQTYSPKQRAKTHKFNETLWIPQTPMQWGQPACWGWGHREHMHLELCEWRTPMPFWQTCCPRSCAGLILLPHHRLPIVLASVFIPSFCPMKLARIWVEEQLSPFLLICLSSLATLKHFPTQCWGVEG